MAAHEVVAERVTAQLRLYLALYRANGSASALSTLNQLVCHSIPLESRLAAGAWPALQEVRQEAVALVEARYADSDSFFT